jgi:hypothetical protein
MEMVMGNNVRKTPLDQASIDWAKALSVALRRWGKENKYPSMRALGQELKIFLSRWEHVLRADSILTNDVEAYAKIYFRTGLEEANPCKIPPTVRVIHDRKRVQERAWTPGEWQEWLHNQTGEPDLFEMKDDHDTEPQTPEFVEDHEDIGELISKLSDQVQVYLSEQKTAEDRDALYKQYGREMYDLKTWLDVLSHSDPLKREGSIRMNAKFSKDLKGG